MDYYVPPTGFKSVLLKLRGNWMAWAGIVMLLIALIHRGFRSPDRAL